jgi:hypothetical protein
MVLLPGCSCCECNVESFFVWGGENSGALSTFITIFPSSPHCVKIVLETSFFSLTVRIRVHNSSTGQTQTLFNESTGAREFCILKDSGFDRVWIDLTNASNSTGSITLTCDDCDCNEFP